MRKSNRLIYFKGKCTFSILFTHTPVVRSLNRKDILSVDLRPDDDTDYTMRADPAVPTVGVANCGASHRRPASRAPRRGAIDGPSGWRTRVVMMMTRTKETEYDYDDDEGVSSSRTEKDGRKKGSGTREGVRVRGRRRSVVRAGRDGAESATWIIDEEQQQPAGGADVFIACVPLEGFERASAMIFGEEGTNPRLEHWMVLVRHAGDEHASVYDYLPAKPKSPVTAASLLAGGSVRGEIRSRRLVGIPGRKCAYVGPTRNGIGGRIAIESAIRAFHERWDVDAVKLGSNACQQHAKELAKWLTCEYGVGLEVVGGSDGQPLECRQVAALPGAELEEEEEEEEKEEEEETSSEDVDDDEEETSADEDGKSKKKKSKKGKKKKSSSSSS